VVFLKKVPVGTILQWIEAKSQCETAATCTSFKNITLLKENTGCLKNICRQFIQNRAWHLTASNFTGYEFKDMKINTPELLQIFCTINRLKHLNES
jgi:hypothetical protein